MILVVGATGILGGEICRRVADRGLPLRALVRPTSDPAKIDKLRTLGAEIVTGDLKDPGSLAAACGGATVVISTANTTLSRQPDDSIADTDQSGQLHLVDAARAAGVGQFVFVSFTGNIEIDSPLRTAKRAVERHLQASGMPYTILRPSIFMEIWLSPALGFDYQNATAQIFGDGERPVSWVSLSDVADFAVDCIGHPAAANAVLELGGPEALTPLEVVRTFEAVSGRPFAVHHVPEAALDAQWRAAEDPLAKSFAALMLGYAQGDPIDMEHTLQAFPLQMTTVRDYAGRVTGS
jgi:NADH dehydrogenase